MALLKVSTAYTRAFLMVQSADHISGLTGATVTANISKAGAAFGAAAGTVSEIANGWYKVALTTADTGTTGDLAYHCTATSGDPTDFTDQVVTLDLTTAIETQVWDALRASHQVAGSFGLSLQLVDDGTAQAGAAGTITLRSGASATDNFYKGNLVFIYAGTGAFEPPNPIASYVGSTKVATMQNTWTVTPDNTSKYFIIPSPFIIDPWDEARSSHTTAGSFGEGVASVQGNVTGATGSVTGAVGSVSGNVGGNVVGSVGSVTGGVTVSANTDKTGYALTAGERQAVADEMLARNVGGGSDGGRTVKDALRFNRNKWTIVGSTLTVYAEDDSTVAWTAAITTAAGNPLASIDPA